MKPDEALQLENRLALASAAQFLRKKSGVVAIISALLLFPCVWHSHIQAGDLGSHVYNAWLARQAQTGHAPGVYVVHQWNNVLFDLSLSATARIFGWHAAELLVVSASVLIFFWGVFAFIAAVTNRIPWALLPCLAMLAYGYSFSMGFLNYYLSLGLACFALAAFWKGGAGNWITAVAIAPLVILAHPIGLAWFAGTIAYVVLRRRLPKYLRWLLPLLVFAGYVALHAFLADSSRYDADWRTDPFYWMNGSDQLMLYGHRYLILARVLLAWAILCFLPYFAHLLSKFRTEAKTFRLPIELYLVALTAAAFVPENIHSELFAGWIGLLVSRLTTVTAIFGLCILGLIPLRKWQIAGFAACAAVFLLFSFQDTAKISRLESNAQILIEKLPRGTRIVPVASAPGDWRVQFIAHSIERACIGRCFSYSNYEPSSGQFRVRVRPGSWVVTDSAEKSEAMSSGDYVVQPEDLPLVSIYQCVDADWTQLCAAPLWAGNKTEDPEPPQSPRSKN
ncbi:MAG: hypothetical protein JSS69_11325 [Acidobacteria bacterium]|nr:hypothetical protein [Acidobacteriota bacterium]MBS1866494.1 hypothetical protein [Acidobacteriota bacterium]